MGPQHSSYIHEHSRTTHSPTIDSLREIDAKTVWDRNDAVQVAEAILVDELSMDGTDRLV